MGKKRSENIGDPAPTAIKDPVEFGGVFYPTHFRFDDKYSNMNPVHIPDGTQVGEVVVENRFGKKSFFVYAVLIWIANGIDLKTISSSGVDSKNQKERKRKKRAFLKRNRQEQVDLQSFLSEGKVAKVCFRRKQKAKATPETTHAKKVREKDKLGKPKSHRGNVRGKLAAGRSSNRGGRMSF